MRGSTGDDRPPGIDIRRWARCADGRGSFTHLFFSDDPHELARAKAICTSLRAARALPGRSAGAAPSRVGCWGGEILIDGAIVAEKRRRGRPPKTPRPPIVVDEVPDVGREDVA